MCLEENWKTWQSDKAKGAIQQQVVSWPQKGVFDQSLKDTKEQATGQAGSGRGPGRETRSASWLAGQRGQGILRWRKKARVLKSVQDGTQAASPTMILSKIIAEQKWSHVRKVLMAIRQAASSSLCKFSYWDRGLSKLVEQLRHWAKPTWNSGLPYRLRYLRTWLCFFILASQKLPRSGHLRKNN